MTRARAVLVAALAVLAVAAPAQAAEAPRMVVNGLARGQLVRFTPYVGLPGFGAQLGVAQAEVSGPQARASAGLADFGNLSLVLGAVAGQVPVPLPALPSPVTADSSGTQEAVRDPLVANFSDSAQMPAGAREEVRAVPDPAARARVVGAGLNVADLLAISGGESRATAVPGATSTTVTLARLALGGGEQPAVVLSDVVWTATQEMGKTGTASFSIGSASVQGQPVDVSGPEGLDALIKMTNETLAGAGLYLEAPAVTTDLAGGAVSALVLQFRNPEPAAAMLGTVTKPVGPVANQVLDAVIAAFPDAEGARLVVNAVLANGSGRSGGRLELGGAAARLSAMELPAPEPLPSGDVEPPSFSLPFPVEPSPVADMPADSAFSAPAAFPAFPATGSGFVPAPPPAATDPAETPLDAPVGEQAFDALPALAPDPLSRGAPAPLVLAGALVAVLALAAADRLRLRKAAP